MRTIYRSYILVLISAVFTLVTAEFPDRWVAKSTVILVSVGCLLVAFLTFLHEGFKWLIWTEAAAAHRASKLPGPIEEWGVGRAKFGRLIVNWVVLIFMGALSFAAIYSAPYSAHPTTIVSPENHRRYSLPHWIMVGFSYGATGVPIEGALGNYLHALQFIWGAVVVVVIPVAFLSKNRG